MVKDVSSSAPGGRHGRHGPLPSVSLLIKVSQVEIGGQKITQRGVLGKWDEGCKTGENAVRDKSRVQFNVFQRLSPFPAVSCAYEGGEKTPPSYRLPTAQSLGRKRDEKKAIGAERRGDSRGREVGGAFFFFFFAFFFPPFE